MKTKKEKLIMEGIELTYASLESHLPWTHGKTSPIEKRRSGSYKFHKRCVKEYARVITIFSELL